MFNRREKGLTFFGHVSDRFRILSRAFFKPVFISIKRYSGALKHVLNKVCSRMHMFCANAVPEGFGDGIRSPCAPAEVVGEFIFFSRGNLAGILRDLFGPAKKCGQIKDQKIREIFRAFSVLRKFVAKIMHFVPNLLCKCATLRIWTLWKAKHGVDFCQGSVNGGFQTVVRVLWGNGIPLPPFYLNLNPFLPQFYLFLTSFSPNFYLNLTSAQPAISNHGLETTVYTPLVLAAKSSPQEK